MAVTLYALGTLVIVGTALPFLKSAVWWIRIFDFPRLHLAMLGLAVLLLSVLVVRRTSAASIIFLVLLLAAVVLQSYQIFPHTALAKRQTISALEVEDTNRVTLLISNVLQSNRHSDRFLEEVYHHDPDIVLAVETNAWWVEQLAVLREVYPYYLEQPQENTYGIVLYSRLPLVEPQIRTLVNEAIPSVFARVELRSGVLVDLYGLHPEPPHPVDNKSTDERDAELVVVAKEVRHHDRPSIVAGDLNDVAWSHTTRLFQRISRLLDPRIGRGLYNTFPAQIPFFRFPLDHVFHSQEFKLVDLRRLDKIGSDHFPMLISLAFDPTVKRMQRPPEKPDRDDFEEAEDKIQSVR